MRFDRLRVTLALAEAFTAPIQPPPPQSENENYVVIDCIKNPVLPAEAEIFCQWIYMDEVKTVTASRCHKNPNGRGGKTATITTRFHKDPLSSTSIEKKCFRNRTSKPVKRIP